MNSQFFMLFTSWTVLLAGYIIVFVYRKQLERSEDDSIHVLADTRVLTNQQAIGHKMDVLERWSKILGVAVILYGIVVAGMYMYSVWQSNLTVS